MTDASAPPPGAGPREGTATVAFDLAAPGGVRRLIGQRGPHRLTLTRQEIVVEHAAALRAPLRFAPGSVVVATVDPGAAVAGKRPAGRFPILHRIAADRVVPREEGTEGWLWTNTDGSALTVLGEDAPNVAFIFSPPLVGDRIEEAFTPDVLRDLAKRSPLGQPAVFGLLLRAEGAERLHETLARFGLAGPLTDREVPPTQRRHLPGDKAANPAVVGARASRATTSMPPPGVR